MSEIKFPNGRVVAYYRVLNEKPEAPKGVTRMQQMDPINRCLQDIGMETDTGGTYAAQLTQEYLNQIMAEGARSIYNWHQKHPEQTSLGVDMIAAEIQVLLRSSSLFESHRFLEHFEYREGPSFMPSQRNYANGLMSSKGLTCLNVDTDYRKDPGINRLLSERLSSEEMAALFTSNKPHSPTSSLLERARHYCISWLKGE